MKKSSTESLSDVIRQYLRENGLETPLNEYRIIKAWSEVLGPAISKYTVDLKIYNQVLFATLSSAVVRNELMMRRTDLIKRLNGHVGAQVITNIVLR